LNFQDAEKTYRDLKRQYDAGILSEEDLEAQVARLQVKDAQGHWWQIGVESGEWYKHDGQQWRQARPPAPPAPAAAPSAAPAPQKRTAPARRDIGDVSPSPTSVGIIAFVVLLIAICACVGLSRMFGGSLLSRATTTPTTRPLALIPTFTLELPLDTPSPTIEATATEQATPTLARPTATRRPTVPTPAGPTATAALNVPPGVYVTNIETVPPKINIGDRFAFSVSFLNTTGSVQTYDWRVKVYECPQQCEDFKHSHGETLVLNSNLPPGTSAVTTSQTFSVGAGISCDLVAIATYVDPVNQFPTPFQSTKNEGRFAFTPCH